LQTDELLRFFDRIEDRFEGFFSLPEELNMGGRENLPWKILSMDLMVNLFFIGMPERKWDDQEETFLEPPLNSEGLVE
jgi:hypothetical protein